MTTEYLNAEGVVKLAMDLSAISRMHFRLCSQRLEGLGLSAGQVPVFMVLSRLDAPAMQHEIAEQVHVTPATISGTLKRMERDGLVTRTVDSNDARISRVALSDKGRELSRKAFEGFVESSRDMFAGFSEAERLELDGFVRRVEDNLAARMTPGEA